MLPFWHTVEFCDEQDRYIGELRADGKPLREVAAIARLWPYRAALNTYRWIPVEGWEGAQRVQWVMDVQYVGGQIVRGAGARGGAIQHHARPPLAERKSHRRRQRRAARLLALGQVLRLTLAAAAAAEEEEWINGQHPAYHGDRIAL